MIDTWNLTTLEILENALYNLQAGRKHLRNGAREAGMISLELADEQLDAAVRVMQLGEK